MKKILTYSIIALGLTLSFLSVNAQEKDVVFFEDFESGWGSWWADNGVWAVGIPTAGPDTAYSILNCAGTILDGTYPNYANTRLISPNINLPTLSGDEKIQLKYWQWFNIENGDDQGILQVSVNSGAWQTISSPEFDGASMVWTQYVADLSAYAGSSVRIAFNFTSDGINFGNGWYIDDISIEKEIVVFLNPEDFELGIGNWSADNGLWEVGIPTVGPGSAHSGQNCVGTVLGGNYPNYANTMLISPGITLPALSGDEKIQLKYWQWFNIENDDDQGILQISVNSGAWQTISSPEFDGASMVWTQYVADLSAYAGSSVRIAFNFTSDGINFGNGWYIDDISIEKEIVVFLNPEDFELGIGNWSADNGLWEVGIPTVGPGSAHSGQNCVGTVLGGNYPNYANTRLISPEITLTPVTGETPILYFYHWYIIGNNYDKGFIQLSVNGGDWQTVSNQITGNNETWSQFAQDLSAYADSIVRIAFYFTSDGINFGNGWYIDDVRIEGAVVGVNEYDASSNQPSFILHQNHPNPFSDQTWISFETKENDVDLNLSVYNISGQLIKSFINTRYKRGNHSLTWDGCDDRGKKVSPGIYFLRLKSEKYSETKRITIVN